MSINWAEVHHIACAFLLVGSLGILVALMVDLALDCADYWWPRLGRVVRRACARRGWL